MAGVSGETVKQPLTDNVDAGSSLTTDTSPIYTQVGEEFAKREAVGRSKEEYVRGDAHTNTVE